MVFNVRMDDSQLIDSLGGPAKLAEMLGFDKDGGTQRVHNWKVRGIPPAVKLAYPAIFLAPRKPIAKGPAIQEQEG